jgi:hypothetical protein
VKTCFAVGLGLYMLPKCVLWDLASVVGRHRPFCLLQLQILFFENVSYFKANINSGTAMCSQELFARVSR